MVEKEGRDLESQEELRATLRKGKLITKTFPLDYTQERDLAQVQYSDDPNVFFLADFGNKVVSKYDYSKEKVIWETEIGGAGNPFAISYNKAKNAIVVAAQGARIYELDADTGDILRHIKSTDLGSIGWVRMVRYHQEQPKYVFFTDYSNHIFARLNMETGGIDHQFGTYDTELHDKTGLSKPVGFDLATNPNTGGIYSDILIADLGNNRLVRVDPDTMEAERYMFMTGIGWVEMWGDHINKTYFDHEYFFVTPSAFRTKTGEKTLLMEDQRTEFIAPFFLDVPTSSPFNQYRFTGCRRTGYEFNMKPLLHRSHPLPDYTTRIADQVSLDANATYPTHKFEGIISNLHKKRAVYVHSDQPATGYIDVPLGIANVRHNRYYDTDFTWEEWDSFNIASGEWTPYIFTNPPPVFRVRVVMGGTAGTISIRTHGWR